MFRFLFLLSLLLICTSSYGQNKDSLLNIVKSEGHDTLKFSAYNELSNYYYRKNYDSSRFYAMQAFLLATKTK